MPATNRDNAAPPTSITIEQSGAFVETFELAPTGEGPLSGLRFAVKDLIDVAGHETACGNPTWKATHPPATVHAVCVEQLLAAGGRCAGKTVTDELAFSLIGENHFYGTPLNPRAPNRVPGGSSSGSASAVACELVDFALGTDTGGSVRVPASNCGIWGLRPTHGLISVAGVMPFAPTFDTVGILAKSAEVLARSASVLLPLGPEGKADDSPTAIYLLRNAFELAAPEIQTALQAPLEKLRSLYGDRVRETSLKESFIEPMNSSFEIWMETYCVMQWGEINSTLGAWIAEAKPKFGPMTAGSFELAQKLDRRRIPQAIARREQCFRQWHQFLGPRDLLCIPTVPKPAPLKGAKDLRTGDYYRRLLSLTSIAGLCRVPQVSMPLAEAAVDEGTAPVGLSLLACCCEDRFLLATAQQIAKA